MSRAEQSTEPADPVFDALAQAALDYGAGEKSIAIGAVGSSPGASYYLLLQGSRDRTAQFDPTMKLGDQGLEMTGLLVEGGATLLIFRGRNEKAPRRMESDTGLG